MKTQYIIPIFVPQLGCKNDCTFCNQKSISGQTKMVTESEIKEKIEYYLSSCNEENIEKEIAFFGGSFTGIDVELQEKFLKIAYEYVKDKRVDSIRISTRPDYISKEILKMLKKYGVKTIELGVQSSNDYILKRCKRGHTFADVKKASKLIRWHGFVLGHQMMVGLPDSTKLDELNTAKDLSKLKPKIMRIYPVLIIKDTELETEYNNKEYVPLNVNQAVERCKEIMYFLNKKKIKVIRVGLQNTDEISNPENEKSQVVAGPYHPAFRQLVECSMWYDAIVERIKTFNIKAREVKISVNPEDFNLVIGHKRENIEKLKEFYDVAVFVERKDDIAIGKFNIEITKTYE